MMMRRFVSDYGMLGALLLLCVYYSWATWDVQHPVGAEGAGQVADEIVSRFGTNARVLVVAQTHAKDVAFAERLRASGLKIVGVVNGGPSDALGALRSNSGLDAIACTHATAQWDVFQGTAAPVVQPRSYKWPNFLKRDNLSNITQQIVVIAILAVGMTMVIMTGGIDLSVGSLIALSAVTAALLIRDAGGGTEATALGMTFACLAAIAVCAAMGLFSGLMVTLFSIPPFIATLGMMLVGSGFAFILAKGQSIDQVPDAFTGLGRGAAVGLPNAVALMVLLYAAAHVVMSRMTFGRHVYAVGGNAEAARLSGVPVKRVLLLVYAICGALAGLGGVVTASQLKSGSPNYGQMYELYAIAAVVVGGTSLAGGEGKVLGTLIGALIIAVIQNGMNLTNVKGYTQKVVFGLVIIGAVLLDSLKRRGWKLRQP